MKRAVVALLTAVVLIVPAAAAAHVSLHPNVIPAGAFATVAVRVPGEQPGAYADKVSMQMPPGFTDADVENIPGWTAHETVTTLRRPLQTAEGPVDQVVSEITWTGDRSALGRIENGYFVLFPLDMTMPSNLAGHSLRFPTVEFYSNGRNAYWIGAPSSAYPAPTINVTKAGGVERLRRRGRACATRPGRARRPPTPRSRAGRRPHPGSRRWHRAAGCPA